MQVTHVPIRPTEAALAAGRPALTPELLAASGARYSRSNEGLSAILDRIDPNNLDASVDSIFRMIDYGHQSIADMAPVAMFIDGVSIWLAYYVWSLCPTAGGQESSTRYIRLTSDGLVPPEELGIPSELHAEWHSAMSRCFQAYERVLGIWEAVATADPSVMRLPKDLLSDSSPSSQRKVARLKRNYAFDRARYLLPVAARTNLMLVMSARAWVTLCQQLLSHALAEANQLGALLREELRLCAPRLLKHAQPTQSFINGLQQEFDALVRSAHECVPPALQDTSVSCEHAATPAIEVSTPQATTATDLARDLSFHDNRYAWTGPTLRRTSVRFSWAAVALAEIRDLNRHRTGNKFCPMRPMGFYCALDQLPDTNAADSCKTILADASELGRQMSFWAHERLSASDPTYVFYTLLGTQYPFEHLTTADKFIYEAELRTGLGAHFRYAQHLRDLLQLWYARFPETRGLVIEGSAEPE